MRRSSWIEIELRVAQRPTSSAEVFMALDRHFSAAVYPLHNGSVVRVNGSKGAKASNIRKIFDARAVDAGRQSINGRRRFYQNALIDYCNTTVLSAIKSSDRLGCRLFKRNIQTLCHWSEQTNPLEFVGNRRKAQILHNETIIFRYFAIL